MRDFGNNLFPEVAKKIETDPGGLTVVNFTREDLVFFKYYLTNKDYYVIIVDDYFFKIIDKKSLIEALYFQARLITMHNLNWDALHESMNDLLNNLGGFKGIYLMFRNGELKKRIPNEFETLLEILAYINQSNGDRQIKVILNKTEEA